MAELIKLTEIEAPDLINFNTSDIIAEIIDRIQRHPDWKEIWNGELRQSALYVIINIFAYLFSKNAEVANRLIRENFILLAKDPNNITNLMSNYGLRIRSNTHSIANIKVTREDGGTLTSDLVLSGIPGSPFIITSTGTTGSSVNFEIYEKDEYGKIDYFRPVILRKGMVNNLLAYSGSTGFETVSINSQEKKEKFFYRLNNSPVIEDSIKVYYFFNDQSIELSETDSFTMPAMGDTDRFPGGQPYYKIIYSSNGNATIVFGTQFFGGSFPKEEIGELRIYYRYGGGAATNVPNGGISYTTIVGNVSLVFTNNGDSGGGVDVEDLNLAKFYAPMRVGRGKQIVDERDSLLALAGMVIKHRVISPKYSILPNKDSVPILHYYNYIVPVRNFTQFQLPIPNSQDTVSSYEYRMRAALNEFLNLSKIHDGSITDEVISDQYTESNLQYALKYKPILSGTLSVSAYDHYGYEIDRLIYSSSYFGETNLNDKNTSTAKIKSYERITESVFNLNDKNQFDFEMDGYLLQITVPNQIDGINIQYNSPSVLATAVNQLIVKKIKDSWTTSQPLMLIPSGQNYITLSYNYFYYENNYFYLNSPTIGANSSLKLIVDKIYSVRNRFLEVIKFNDSEIVTRFSYAIPESRKIFLDNSNFNYVNNSLEIKLNSDDINRLKTLNNLIVWQDRESNVGPKLSYSLRDDNLRNIFVKQNSNVEIEVYDKFGTLRDYLVYESVAPSQRTPGIRQDTNRDGNEITGQLEIFKEASVDGNGLYIDSYFDYENSIAYFCLTNADDEQTSAPYSFPRESFVNSFFDNSISDSWAQYDDGIEANLPVDGFGKKFNFISNNFVIFPSPDITLPNQIPTGWQYYYDTFDQTEIVLQEQEDPNESNWYYDNISYEEKTMVPRVDENGAPVLDDNGAQIIDETWLPYSTNIYFKTQYDIIVADTINYRNIVIGTLVKPLIEVPVEVINTLPSQTVVDGTGNVNYVNNKLSLSREIVSENNLPNPKYLLEKKTENGLGCGISYHFEIAQENTNSQLKLKFDYSIFTDENYVSEFVNGDIITYIIAENSSNAVVYETVAIISTVNTFDVTWNSIDFKNYKLVFHIPNDKLNKYKILFDNVRIYQEPIDSTYYLELITDNIDNIILYKPETDETLNQIVRGQGVAYDVSLTNNSLANLNMTYVINDGSYKDILAISVIGIKLINNEYVYTLLDLNDNYDSTNTTVKAYTVKLNNINNNKVSVSFNTGMYDKYRIIIHSRIDQNQSFQITFGNISVGVKPEDIYNQDFYFKLYFGREKFNTIKCNYEPHPYFQEDESMGFLDILRNQNKRIIGVEPLLKKINYNPLGLSLLLTFGATAKTEEVLNQVETAIVDNFSYNNENENIKIGEIFSLDLVGQKIIENFSKSGLVGARVTDVNSLINESPLGDDYYFVAPPILYESLLTLETEYSNIKGIADKYQLKVTYLKL